MAGPPSIGSPFPENTLPSMSLLRAIFMVSPRNLTLVSLLTSRPLVPSNTCITAMFSDTSSTCPVLSVPSAPTIFTISAKPTSLVFSTKTRGPCMSEAVWYVRALDILEDSTICFSPRVCFQEYRIKLMILSFFFFLLSLFFLFFLGLVVFCFLIFCVFSFQML